MNEAAKDMLDEACAMFVESGNEMEVSALQSCQCQKQGMKMDGQVLCFRFGLTLSVCL